MKDPEAFPFKWPSKGWRLECSQVKINIVHLWHQGWINTKHELSPMDTAPVCLPFVRHDAWEWGHSSTRRWQKRMLVLCLRSQKSTYHWNKSVYLRVWVAKSGKVSVTRGRHTHRLWVNQYDKGQVTILGFPKLVRRATQCQSTPRQHNYMSLYTHHWCTQVWTGDTNRTRCSVIRTYDADVLNVGCMGQIFRGKWISCHYMHVTGIKKCDIMANVARKEQNYSVCTTVLRHQWSARNSCVLIVVLFTRNFQGYPAHKSLLVLVCSVPFMWPKK